MSIVSRIALVVLGLSVVGGFAYSQWLAPREPIAAAEQFLGAVREQAWESALSAMSERYRERHTHADLEARVRDIPRLFDHTQVWFGNASVRQNAALLDGTLVGRGQEVPLAVELRHTEGSWRVEHVVIHGVPLE